MLLYIAVHRKTWTNNRSKPVDDVKAVITIITVITLSPGKNLRHQSGYFYTRNTEGREEKDHEAKQFPPQHHVSSPPDLLKPFNDQTKGKTFWWHFSTKHRRNMFVFFSPRSWNIINNNVVRTRVKLVLTYFWNIQKLIYICNNCGQKSIVT